MAGVWATAFQSALAIANEVERETDLNPLIFSRKRKSIDDDDDEIGAFKQPVKLARFFAAKNNDNEEFEKRNNRITRAELKTSEVNIDEIDSSRNVLPSKDIETGENYRSSYQKLSLEERCAKQVCRKWLKSEFLETGQICDETCGRLHEIPENPQKLYKDFSFKGLPPKQQKKILANINLRASASKPI